MDDKWVGPVLLSLVIILSSFLLVYLSSASGTESVTLAEYLPTPRPSEPCDVCEPNNSLSQACGPLAPGESYHYGCTTNRDHDYYYIDLEVTGTGVFSLTQLSTDYDIYVYDENRNLVCYSAQYGPVPEYVVCDLDQPGRYYIWVHPYTDCIVCAPYTLAIAYPTLAPTSVPTPTPAPPCNVHIDDFSDMNPDNDLGLPSGWELDPPGCGTITPTYTGSELRLDYDLVSPDCTARYTTGLSLSAHPYELLAFEIKGSDREELASAVIGLSDEAGHKMGVKAGDFLNQVLTDTWQGGAVPLAVFATAVDMTQLDTLFIEFADTRGASQGTIYLDSFRLEMPLAPLTVHNCDDRTDPNGLGGGTGIFTDPGATLQTAYIAHDTHDHSPGSCVISYTLPSGTWALWETYLLGVDVSDYAFLSFYVRGADGGEKVNLYLEDGDGQKDYVDVEDYVPNDAISTDWTSVRIPLQAFEGLVLTDLDKIKFVFEWEPMTGTIFLDDLRFIADNLLVDSFCDGDENNSLNGETGLFTSSPSCTAAVTSTLSSHVLRLDYDVTAGPGCYSGYWSRTLLDLNPYRTLVAKVRGERCGQVPAISARTIPVGPEKIKLSDYLLDGVTDEWQEARIPLAASSVITDWTRGDSYVVAFEAYRGASEGTTWWDDVAFETACAPLWVDNFNDEDNANALGGESRVFESGAQVTSTLYITQAYGDAGARLVLDYAVSAGMDKYAGWETWLQDANLSNYDRLTFNFKIEGDGKPNVWLEDADNERRQVNLESYATLSPEWQTVVIPLRSFHGLDMTRIKALQFVIGEWESPPVQGMLSLDNIQFLPSANCSQVIQNEVSLPLIAGEYTPLSLDPVWDFESDTEGWTTYTVISYSRAVITVETSSFRSLSGNASLAMIMDLVGGDSRLDRGAAFVDLSAPLDLSCKPLSCWLYVPTCGLGDPAAPNYVRLFVKDENDKDEYGTITPVVRNQWFEVDLRPSTLEPHEGWMEPGFDPHAIIRLGVQFRAGSEEATYRGKVYLDACGWQEIDSSCIATRACRPDEGLERVSGPSLYTVK